MCMGFVGSDIGTRKFRLLQELKLCFHLPREYEILQERSCSGTVNSDTKISKRMYSV